MGFQSDDHELLLVEWVDSMQPIPSWHHLSDPPSCKTIQCISVGWEVGSTSETLMLAPNIGNSDAGNAQGSGFICIPKVSITKTMRLGLLMDEANSALVKSRE